MLTGKSIYRVLFWGLIVIGILLTIPPANAKTIDVATTGPYTSIQAAIDNASAGDVILVHGGTYVGPVIVTKPLTLTGLTGANGSAVIDGNNSGYAVRVYASGVTVQGFTVVNPGIRGILVHKANNAQIRNNTIQDAVADGIGVYESNKVVLDNNKLYNCSYGIWMSSCDGNTATNNHFKHNREIEFYCEGLTNCLVGGNYFDYAGYSGSDDDGVDGFKARNCSYLTFDDNFMTAIIMALYSTPVIISPAAIIPPGIPA